jgi:hypothetical protein
MTQKREELEALSDEELLGEAVIEEKRQEAIHELTEWREEELDDMSLEELIGEEQAQALREQTIEDWIEQYEEELSNESNEELLEGWLEEAREMEIERRLAEEGEEVDGEHALEMAEKEEGEL